MSRQSTISVFVTDHQPLFLDGLVRAVRQDATFQVVGEAADGRTALDEIRNRRPDVALLDLELPSLSGERIVRAAKRDRVPTRFVGLTANLRAEAVYALVAAGAVSCVAKDVGVDELRAVVVAAATGRPVVAGEALDALVRAIRFRSGRDEPPLSDRELEILRLLAGGHSVPAIARALAISPGTVRTHVTHLFDKLETRDRTAAVVRAMRLGYLD